MRRGELGSPALGWRACKVCGCLENVGGGSSENENRSPRTVPHSHVRHAPGGLETGRQRQGRAHVRGSAHGEQQAGGQLR